VFGESVDACFARVCSTVVAEAGAVEVMARGQ